MSLFICSHAHLIFSHISQSQLLLPSNFATLLSPYMYETTWRCGAKDLFRSFLTQPIWWSLLAFCFSCCSHNSIRVLTALFPCFCISCARGYIWVLWEERVCGNWTAAGFVLTDWTSYLGHNISGEIWFGIYMNFLQPLWIWCGIVRHAMVEEILENVCLLAVIVRGINKSKYNVVIF